MYGDQSLNISATTIFTNQTASNLPGPGRLLGNAYDVAGRALEKRIRKLLRRRKKQHVAEASPSTIRSEFNDESSDVRTFSTYSTNFTASNLPGAGRILGLVFESAGAKLEEAVNKWVVDHDRIGPDVYARKARQLVNRARGDEDEEEDASGWLEDELLIGTLKRLLKYLRSNVPYLQLLAFRHVIALVIEDFRYRDLLLRLGTTEIMKAFNPDLIYYRDLSMRDILLTSSRKALACLEEYHLFEVASAMSGPQSERFEVGAIYLVQTFSDPKRCFIAMRLLKDRSKRFSTSSWNAAFNFCMESIAKLSASSPSDLEWDTVDSLLSLCAAAYLCGGIMKFTFDLLGQIMQSIIRNASKLPRTIQSLRDVLDFSSMGSLGGITVGPGTQAFIESLKLVENHSSHSSLDELFDSLSTRYPNPSLTFLWKLISAHPNVIVSELMARLVFCAETGLLRFVKEIDDERQSLCSSLTSYLASPDKQTREEAEGFVEEVMALDWFHKKTILDCIVSLCTTLYDSTLMNFARRLWDTVTTSRLNDLCPPIILHQSHTLFRHKCANGEVHVRFDDPYTRKMPCRECVRVGEWEDLLQNDEIVCERLWNVTDVAYEGARLRAGWLVIERGSHPFHRGVYRPVLAYIDSQMHPQYVAEVVFKADPRAVGEDERRFACVAGFDDDGLIMPLTSSMATIEGDMNMERWTVSSFSVLTVFAESRGWMDVATAEVGGKDLTAPFYWK